MKFEQLKERVILQKMVKGRHPNSGEPVTDVGEEYRVWGQLKMVSHSQESFTNERDVSVADATLFIRYREDVDGHWRVRDSKGRVWKIIGEPKEIGFREGLAISIERMN